MTRLPSRRLLIALLPAVLVVGAFAPASSAAAAPATAFADLRTLADLHAEFGLESGLTITPSTETLELHLPPLVDRPVVQELWVELVGPDGGFGVRLPMPDTGSVLPVQVGAGLFDPVAPVSGTFDLRITGTPEGAPYGSGILSTKIDIHAVLLVVPGADSTHVVDLDPATATPIAAGGTPYVATSVLTNVGDTLPATFGSELTIVSAPGTYTSGLEGAWRAPAVTAVLHNNDFEVLPVQTALPFTVAPDGASITVQLPSALPPSPYDPGLGDPWATGTAVRVDLTDAAGRGSLQVLVQVALEAEPPVVVAGDARILGGARPFRTLRVETDGWGPDGTLLAYRWLRDGRPIVGATALTYRARLADLYHRLTVEVTGSLPGAEPVAVVSRPVRIRLF